MTDIIEWLRDPAFPPPPAGAMALRLSAADEIERLRGIIATIAWHNAQTQQDALDMREFALDEMRRRALDSI